jgi:hypothetical protein
MICSGDSILAMGRKLRIPIIKVTIQAVIVIALEGSALSAATLDLFTRNCGRSLDQKPSSKQARAGIIVSQFKNERFPLSISVICSNTITTPAI